ncbi:MAG: iron ABC transporter permease [Deltaproteobacteria bacterium]|nr:MAG: iron ABC transporter permease [Deltaproteobacteria bacterium]
MPAGLVGDYQKAFLKKSWLFLGLLLLLVLLVLLSVSVGSYRLSLSQLVRSLLGLEEGAPQVVIWNVRLPRIAAALVTGGGLGISGLAIQGLLRNPLGSPFTLGISQGAAFGASFAIIVLATESMPAAATGLAGAWGILSTTGCAFLGAAATTAIILLLARLRRMSAESIILAGVALSSLFMAATILVQYFASEQEIARAVFWTFGDVSRSGWPEIAVLAAVTSLVIIYFIHQRWNLNALSAGDDVARSLGVSVERLRLGGMLLAAAVAALATAFNGVIAFLGLLAPHIARRIAGVDYRLSIPFSCLVGAELLLAADTLGRLVVGSGALPVGVLTSFMGAPLFLYLLLKGARR